MVTLTPQNPSTTGLNTFRNSDLDIAESFFRDESLKNPHDQESLYNLIKILDLRHKYKDINNIINKNTNKIKTWNNSLLFLSGKSLLKSKNYNQACKVLGFLNDKQTEKIEVPILYSESLFRLGDLENANKIITSSLRKWPKDPSLMNNKAIILSELGHYQEAEKTYLSIIKLLPNHFLGYFNLSLFYEKQYRLEEATFNLKCCLRIVPDAPEALEALDRIRNKFIKSGNKKDIKDIIYNLFAKKEWEKAYLSLKSKQTEIEKTQFYAFISEMPTIYQDKLASSDYFNLNKIVKSYNLFESNDKDIDLLISSLKEESSLKWDRVDKPTRNGFQTHEILMNKNNIYFGILENKLITKIKEYLKHSMFSKLKYFNKSLNLSGWGVILKSGGKQEKHIHPRSLISGVLYLKTPNTYTKKQNHDGNLLFPTGEKLYIEPKPGLLVLFPSYLPHETIPFQSSDERICIAFNYQP